MTGGMDARTALAQLDDLFEELEELLKRSEAAEGLAERSVNSSIALVAAQGLRAYVKGNKEQAADDLATAAEEVKARLAAARERGDVSN